VGVFIVKSKDSFFLLFPLSIMKPCTTKKKWVAVEKAKKTRLQWYLQKKKTVENGRESLAPLKPATLLFRFVGGSGLGAPDVHGHALRWLIATIGLLQQRRHERQA